MSRGALKLVAVDPGIDSRPWRCRPTRGTSPKEPRPPWMALPRPFRPGAKGIRVSSGGTSFSNCSKRLLVQSRKQSPGRVRPARPCVSTPRSLLHGLSLLQVVTPCVDHVVVGEASGLREEGELHLGSRVEALWSARSLAGVDDLDAGAESTLSKSGPSGARHVVDGDR